MISLGASLIDECLFRPFAAQGAKVAFVDRAQSQGERVAAMWSDQGYTVEFVC